MGCQLSETGVHIYLPTQTPEILRSPLHHTLGELSIPAVSRGILELRDWLEVLATVAATAINQLM